jgi:hypothetical protein
VGWRSSAPIRLVNAHQGLASRRLLPVQSHEGLVRLDCQGDVDSIAAATAMVGGDRGCPCSRDRRRPSRSRL